jgi:hypothetical protein
MQGLLSPATTLIVRTATILTDQVRQIGSVYRGRSALKVGHTRKDREIAVGIVDLIETAVRNGRILCISHPDQLDQGYPDSNRWT